MSEPVSEIIENELAIRRGIEAQGVDVLDVSTTDTHWRIVVKCKDETRSVSALVSLGVAEAIRTALNRDIGWGLQGPAFPEGCK